MKTFIADVKDESERMKIIPKKYRKCKACGKKLSEKMENYKERGERLKILITEIKDIESEL